MKGVAKDGSAKNTDKKTYSTRSKKLTSASEEIQSTVNQEPTKDSSQKPNFSKFKFSREEKPKLSSISPKKRQHINPEYDDISPSKIKIELDENTGEIQKKIDLQSPIKTENARTPSNWEAVLNNLREMRQKRDAPVDSMGTQKAADEAETPEVC